MALPADLSLVAGNRPGSYNKIRYMKYPDRYLFSSLCPFLLLSGDFLSMLRISPYIAEQPDLLKIQVFFDNSIASSTMSLIRSSPFCQKSSLVISTPTLPTSFSGESLPPEDSRSIYLGTNFLPSSRYCL